VSLTCKGKILEPVIIRPPRFNFGRLSRKAPPQTETIQITRGDAPNFDLKLTPVEDKAIKAELREVEAHEKYELIVTLDPANAAEVVSGKVQLETGVPESPNAVVTLHGNIIPRVTTSPNRFSIQANEPEERTLAVELNWDDGKPGKILSSSVNDPKLAVQVDEQSGVQVVRLTVPAEYNPGSGAQAVILLTDDPNAQTVRVPISVRRTVTRPKTGAS